MNLCKDGMFWCAFELVSGVGLAVLFVIFIAVMLGFFDGYERKDK